MEPPDRASWIELDRSALVHNLSAFRDCVGASSIGATLKGNAYGHGYAQVLAAVHAHVDWVFVITAAEALQVRQLEADRSADPVQVLVLGAVSADEVLRLAEADVAVVVSDPADGARVCAAAAAASRPVRVHLHLDTGLGREGWGVDQVEQAVAWLDRAGEGVRVEGVMTHFANTEDVTEQAYAQQQLTAFAEGRARLEAVLAAKDRPAPQVAHCAASAPALVLPDAAMDVVRLGIGLYGFWPSVETRLSARLIRGALPDLRPVLSWRVRPQLVKWLQAGSFVGYGCTHRCVERTRVAVLPVGYWDGYPRLASGRAHVLVGGQRCAVLGRVMMNHLIVDVTRVPEVDEQTVVTLLGAEGSEVVRAEDLATWSQTIHYEVVTRLGAHVERRVVG